MSVKSIKNEKTKFRNQVSYRYRKCLARHASEMHILHTASWTIPRKHKRHIFHLLNSSIVLQTYKLKHIKDIKLQHQPPQSFVKAICIQFTNSQLVLLKSGPGSVVDLIRSCAISSWEAAQSLERSFVSTFTFPWEHDFSSRALCTQQTTKIGTNNSIRIQCNFEMVLLVVTHDHDEFQSSSSVKYSFKVATALQYVDQKGRKLSFLIFNILQCIHNLSL